MGLLDRRDICHAILCDFVYTNREWGKEIAKEKWEPGKGKQG